MFKYSIEAPSSESVLIRKCLLEGTRLDGRKLGDFREVKLTLNRVGAMQSVAEVQIAESRAICSVKGQIVAPFIDRPSEGVLNFSVETTQLSPLCKITDVELSRILERSIKDSDALDLESLCLISGVQVWSISCDVKLLDSSGGNIIDICILAAMCALRAFRKPEVSIETVGMGIVTERPIMKTVFDGSHTDVSYPLPLHHTVAPVTIGFFKVTENLLNHLEPEAHFQSALKKSGGYLFPETSSSSTRATGDGAGNTQQQQLNSGIAVIVDPSMEEMRSMDGYITFCINAHMEICTIYKPGFLAVPHTVIMSCIKLISNQINSLHQRIASEVSMLDEAEVVKKNKKMDALRQYNYFRTLGDQSNSINSNSSNNSSSGGSSSNNMVTGGGGGGVEDSSKVISRDDPMLAWSHLHQSASSV